MPSQRVEIPIGRREAPARSPFVSSQSAINCFLEADAEGDALYGGFGLTEFADCGNGGIRGIYNFKGTCLAVSGSKLFTIDANGNETDRGGIPGVDPVVISDNGTHAAIVSDVTTYLWNGSTRAQITDPDFPGASSVDFLDQYLVFTQRNSQRFFISELGDAVNYDALDVATAESKPDNLKRVFVNANEALLFGDLSVEGRYDSGAADFPLSKSATSLDYGLIGTHAVCAIDNTVGWVAHDVTVRTLRSASPIAIADPAITTLIQSWSDPDTIRCFNVTLGGHEWMAIRHDEGCVLWDATTQLWHRRQSYGMASWRVGCSARAFGKVLLGDTESGKIWQLDPNAYAEGADLLVRTLTSRTLGIGGMPFTLDSVEVEMEVGVGLITGQGSDPKVWMQLSRDSGERFGARLFRSMGARGKRRVRVIWQGPFGDFPPHGGVIQIGCSDPVRLVVTKAWAQVTPNR